MRIQKKPNVFTLHNSIAVDSSPHSRRVSPPKN